MTLAARTADPAEAPVSVAEAKAQLRIEHSDDDTLIGDLINAATGAVEGATGRALVTQTWQFQTRRLVQRERFILPRLPVSAITAVQYLDGSEAEQTAALSDFELVQDDWSACVVPTYGNSWPTMPWRPDAVRVTATCGYGEAADVPQSIRTAITMLVDFWFHRPAAMDADAGQWPMPVHALLSQYKTGWVAG